jgi:hypothetical protein
LGPGRIPGGTDRAGADRLLKLYLDGAHASNGRPEMRAHLYRLVTMDAK